MLHVVEGKSAKTNEAMNKVRQQERLEHNKLKGYKYTFLKNQILLPDNKKASLNELITLCPILGEAYQLNPLFNDLWEMPNKQAARAFIGQWCTEVEQSKIKPFMIFSKTVKPHLSGIVNVVEIHITNAILESINNKIQIAKRRARDFQNTNNFISMIYFLCGKLKFNYPLYST